MTNKIHGKGGSTDRGFMTMLIVCRNPTCTFAGVAPTSLTQHLAKSSYCRYYYHSAQTVDKDEDDDNNSNVSELSMDDVLEFPTNEDLEEIPITAENDINVRHAWFRDRMKWNPQVAMQVELFRKIRKSGGSQSLQEDVVRTINTYLHQIGQVPLWSCKRLMSYLWAQADYSGPETTRVTLEKHGESTLVQHFNLFDVVKRILRDPKLQDPSKIDVKSESEPHAPYVPSSCDDTISNTFDANVYRNMMAEITTEDDTLILMLSGYSDGVEVTKNSKQKVSPFFLYSMMLKEDYRDLQSYFLWFIAPKANNSTSAEKKKERRSGLDKRGRPTRDRMAVTETMMKKFREEAEFLRTRKWAVMLAGTVKMVRIDLRFVYFTGDMEKTNEWCGVYTSGGERALCKCDCARVQCDDPMADCRDQDQRRIEQCIRTLIPVPFKKPRYHTLLQKDLMLKFQNASLYVTDNAFWNLPWLTARSTIYNSTPFDYLHCLLLGILKNTCLEIENRLDKGRCAVRVDQAADRILFRLRSTGNVPRLNKFDGFTNTSKLNGQEFIGYAWGMCALLHLDTDDALFGGILSDEPADIEKWRTFLSNRRKYHEGRAPMPHVPDRQNISRHQLIELLERLLVIVGLCQAPVISRERIPHIRAYVRDFGTMLPALLPRRTACDWRIPKFHELMHMADDIERFGPPREYGCSEGERLMKKYADRARKCTNKSPAALEKSLLERELEEIVLDQVSPDLPNTESRMPTRTGDDANGIFFVVSSSSSARARQIMAPTWTKGKHKKETMGLPEYTKRFFIGNMESTTTIRVEIQTERRCGDQIIRADAYGTDTTRLETERSDFVYYSPAGVDDISIETMPAHSEDDRQHLLFGQVLCIYRLPSRYGSSTLVEWKALIHRFTAMESKGSDLIFRLYKREYEGDAGEDPCCYAVVPFTSIVKRRDGVSWQQNPVTMSPMNSTQDIYVLDVMPQENYARAMATRQGTSTTTTEQQS